ncbi:hypothetical protein [Alkaliphilus serpentinus]|uniref:Uncharacterized protein n=1 Tax=Alkaliphilus serpentinus TaxID=1482731 RepID=A0A833M8I5_9FIRM|nr:hypothetical protein [Alkaliphilus serpentinus]KAB3525839.1 hypothetical protein F8153_14605 [Alkaliphilus serpentinus]
MKKLKGFKLILMVLIIVTVATGCSRGKDAEKLLGQWLLLSDFQETLTIEKLDKGFLWTDKDGEFSAAFKDGKLSLETGQTYAQYNDEKENLVVLRLNDEGYFIGKKNFTNKIRLLINQFFNKSKYNLLVENAEAFKEFMTESFYQSVQEVKKERMDNGLILREKIESNHTLTFGDVEIISGNGVMITVTVHYHSLMRSMAEDHVFENGKTEIEYKGSETLEFYLLYEEESFKIDNIESTYFDEEFLDSDGNWVKK